MNKQELNRRELVAYIREHDKRYAEFNFNEHFYSDHTLRVIKKRIERERVRKKKK